MGMQCAGAPLEISEDLVTTFNIGLVVRGTISETSVDPKEQQAQEERYKAPKETSIFRYATCLSCAHAQLPVIHCISLRETWQLVWPAQHCFLCAARCTHAAQAIPTNIQVATAGCA